jgi:hypothetical protein
MRLLKIQPEVRGEWFVAGIIPYNESKPHMTVYDTDYEYLNVSVGYLEQYTELPEPEIETLISLMGIPILESSIMYYIPDSHWAVELW